MKGNLIMKKSFKTIISVILAIIMTMSVMITPISASEGEVELDISNETKFDWGDTVTFNIVIKNNTDSRITNVDLVSEAKGMSEYFDETEDSVGMIDYITPGATRTVEVKYATESISGISSFFRGISTFFSQLFSRFSRSYAYTEKIKVGFSNVTFGIDVDYEVAPPTTSGNVNLDDPDPEVEIYSFATDTYDILIGETKTVTFTSEIFSNIELEDSAVTVIDEDNNTIGTMNDNGANGDITADDGIYTLKVALSSNEVGGKKYYSSVRNVLSNDLTIGFYRNFTDSDFANYEYVSNEIEIAISPFIDDNGYIIEGKEQEAIDAIETALDKQKREGRVVSYTANELEYEITLVDDFVFSYMLMQAGQESGVGSCELVTIQSFKGQWTDSSLNAGSDSMTDGSAQLIANTFDEYVFSKNLDNEEVTLDSIKGLKEDSVVVINTHGGYSEKYGSKICLGQSRTTAINEDYKEDYWAGRIGYSGAAGKSVYSISGGFIEKYCDNLNNSLIYLGACSTCKDMLDGQSNEYELAQAFIDKGATAVVGTNNTVSARYDYDFGIALFKGLTKVSDDKYYTLQQAFDYATEIAGSSDSRGTHFDIYPLNSAKAQNFRLHEIEKGNLAGVIKNASTGSAVSNALIRVYKDGELVASTRTDWSGTYNLAVPAGDYVLKVSAGSFKTAKMAVTVRANVTTYNETFLLIFNGLSAGYANGSTINAITGQLLPNVSINIRNSWNNQQGQIIQTITSNENGYYEVSLPAGLYTFECYKDGYITTYKNVIVFVYDYGSQDISVAPELGEGYYRVVLTWGENPHDLDSHLFGTTDEYSYRVYYGSKNAYNTNGDFVANLDVDDTSSYGPETTTFFVESDAKYEFYVDWFSGYGTWASSGGKVEVYNGAYLINTYYVPSVDNYYGSWKVFSIEDGVYTSHNIIQSNDIY